MLWRYPEPRVLTLVRITPVPFNTTEDPDISTADLGDVLQVCGGWVFPFQNKSIMRKCLEHTFYISHSKHKYITCVLYLYVQKEELYFDVSRPPKVVQIEGSSRGQVACRKLGDSQQPESVLGHAMFYNLIKI